MVSPHRVLRNRRRVPRNSLRTMADQELIDPPTPVPDGYTYLGVGGSFRTTGRFIGITCPVEPFPGRPHKWGNPGSLRGNDRTLHYSAPTSAIVDRTNQITVTRQPPPLPPPLPDGYTYLGMGRTFTVPDGGFPGMFCRERSTGWGHPGNLAWGHQGKLTGEGPTIHYAARTDSHIVSLNTEHLPPMPTQPPVFSPSGHALPPLPEGYVLLGMGGTFKLTNIHAPRHFDPFDGMTYSPISRGPQWTSIATLSGNAPHLYYAVHKDSPIAKLNEAQPTTEPTEPAIEMTYEVAGPAPASLDVDEADQSIDSPERVVVAFLWKESLQGADFWRAYCKKTNIPERSKARAILRYWLRTDKTQSVLVEPPTPKGPGHPIPSDFNKDTAKQALTDPAKVACAFTWYLSKLGTAFWADYRHQTISPEHNQMAKDILSDWVQRWEDGERPCHK